MVTKECLLTTLKNYEGAIIFISHDRYFINSLADYILYLSRDLSLVVEGNYEDLKEKIGIESKIEEEKEVKKVKELVYDKIETKPKLSNNKIKEYKDKLADIEKRLEEINDLLNMDFEDYKEIDALTDERSELEEKYFEILNILDEN